MESLRSAFYEFGPFRIDAKERLLLRAGQVLTLSPRAFDTLLLLVENQGHVMRKEEMMSRLWPDTFVEEANLTNNISMLRKALGETQNECPYIQTVPRVGYRFVTSVKEVTNIGISKASAETSLTGAEPVSQTSSVQYPGTQNPFGQKISIVEYLVSEIKQHQLVLLVVLAILVGGLALTYGIYRFTRPHGTNAHFQNLNKLQFTALTTVGNAIDATVSPDGRLIVYVQRENGKYSLWTKTVATDSAIQIVPSTEALAMGKTTFSPDGNYVYYSVKETTGPDVLYQVKVLGGVPRKVLTTESASALTFSPDGKRFAFVRDSEDTQLVIVNTDGTDERILARRSGDAAFSVGGPSWSPDGKIIAIGAFVPGGAARRVMMVGVKVESGEVKALSQQSWYRIGRVDWFRDGSGLILTADEKPASKGQLWQLKYPDGEVRRLTTNDLDDYGPVSITRDAGALVTIRTRKSSNIWVVPHGDATQARRITSRGEAREGAAGLAWTPDGRIVYSSKAADGVYSKIWIMNADGTNPRQLTDAPANDWFPDVSPDGRYIVFASNLSGKFNLWRMDINGSNLKQLTNGVAYSPDFSPDGSWIACSFGDHEKRSIWKFPSDGSSPVQLTRKSGAVPTVSRDGKLIAYDAYEEQAEKKTKLVIIPSEGGEPVKVLDYTPLWETGLQWSPDGRSIIYINMLQGGANLWRLPIDGSPAQQLTDFKSEQIFSFEFTRDGRQLACARGTVTSDVVMISESK